LPNFNEARTAKRGRAETIGCDLQGLLQQKGIDLAWFSAG
jgi:hypothetical protein